MQNNNNIFEKDIATFKALLKKIKDPLNMSNGYVEYSRLEDKVIALNMHPQDALISLLIDDLTDDTPSHSKIIKSYMLSNVLKSFIEQKETVASPFIQLMQRKASGPLLDDLNNFSGNHPEKLIRYMVSYIHDAEEQNDHDRLSASYADNNAQGGTEKAACSQVSTTLSQMKTQVYHSMTAYNEANAIRKQVIEHRKSEQAELSH